MSRAYPVFRVLGGLLVGLALFMLPALISDLGEAQWHRSGFFAGAAIALMTGGALIVLGSSSEPFFLTRRQAFLCTGLAWILIPAFAAVPFLDFGMSFADSYFEAVSGLTTTGSTVMTGLDDASPAILLWRSMLQWLGGVGIIVLGIVVMPFLRVGGMQLFHTESSDQSEKIFARSFDLARWIAGVYFGLTILCAASYAMLGMSDFDAVNHAMTTIATGGFSTHDASFGHFSNPGLEWAGAIFMALGALPFVAYIRSIRGRRDALLADVQVRGFVAFLLLAIAAIGVTNSWINDAPFGEALRLATFNVTSIVTTTGYASADYQTWGAFAVGAFFILTFVGGCSGSTSGAIKIYRFQILGSLAMKHLTRLISPSRIIVVTYSTRVVDDEVAYAIMTFLTTVLFSLAAFSLLLAWMGIDLVTAISAAATCLTNVGPGLGDIVGPAGNFEPLPASAKLVLSAAMLLGRLEYLTLLVMLSPAFWRA